MGDIRRKLKICLICVAAAAVLVGVFYYFHDARKEESSGKGTLIAAPLKAGGVR